MTLSEYILENTDDGIDIARLLIDVMNGFIRGVKLSHRLTAARLLTIYGFQDARDFIDENTLNPSDDGRQWVISDPELSRLIRARTNDGQEVCLFLIDVMAGRVEGIRVGHRVSAARELLNRAFGRSPGIPLPNPPRATAPRGTIRNTDQQVESALVRSEHVEESEPVEEQSAPPDQTQVQTEPDQQVASAPVRPEPSRREPVEGQSVPPTQTATQSEPPQPEAGGDFDPEVYRAASRCIDPNFDPMLEATDEDYFFNYDGCDNISCPYHGDPEDPDYDPNAHHY